MVSIVGVLLALTLQAPKIEGDYVCRGVSERGNYSIPLTVTLEGEDYFFSWQDGAMVGLGVRQGDWIAVAILNRSTGSVGVALYKIEPGMLVGRWSGGRGAYPETCIAGKPA
jgi:hypothetical protein